MKPVAALWVFAAFASRLLCGQGIGVTGKVILEDGRAVSGAQVVAEFRPSGDPAAAQQLEAVSSNDGSFRFPQLGEGTYQFCASIPGGDLLDTCEWAKPVQIEMRSGQTQDGVRLVLAEGELIHFRIHDQGALLARKATGPKPAIHLGVWSRNGLFHPASALPAANGVVDYQIRVPREEEHNVGVYGLSVTFRDREGRAVRPGNRRVRSSSGGVGKRALPTVLEYSISAAEEK